MSLVYA